MTRSPIIELAAALLLLLAPIPAHSADDFREVSVPPTFTVRPDRAYLLIRSNVRSADPVFLRVPDDRELAQYAAAKQAAFQHDQAKLIRDRDALLAQKAAAEADGQPFDKVIPPEPTLDTYQFFYNDTRNLFPISFGKAIEKSGDLRTVLVEVRPGTYVIYGVGFGVNMQTCLCLGTVSVAAKAGQIVDLGTLLIGQASEPSAIPELAGITGLGPSMIGHLGTWAVAVRPVGPTTSVPAALAGKPIERASYHAVGKFISPFAFGINRLAPITGVLAYRGGDVVDAVSNSVVENHY